MGVFKKKNNNKEIRSIIKEYYGNNYSFFAYSYMENIYNIPEVRTAIESFADIFSTIPKYHERIDKLGNITYFEDEITKIISLRPNVLQNATQFWKELITRLMLESNVFIEPIFDKFNGQLKYLYVLPSKQFQLKYINDGTATVTFLDSINGNKERNLNELIYLNRFSSLSGGKKNNLGLYETVIQALMQQALTVANPKKVRAILQGKQNISSNLPKNDKKGVLEDVKANFADNVDGLVYFENQWNVTPINWQENDVNRELMKLVINTVYNYFGITNNIINGTATEIEYSMFIANKINPIAKQIEQEFTNKLFTSNEINFGNKIELDTFALSVSTLQAKTAFFNTGLRAGVLNLDEAREMVGLSPIPDGFGKMWRTTADTIDITKVNEYQASQKGVTNSVSEDKKNNKEEFNGKKNNI